MHTHTTHTHTSHAHTHIRHIHTQIDVVRPTGTWQRRQQRGKHAKTVLDNRSWPSPTSWPSFDWWAIEEGGLTPHDTWRVRENESEWWAHQAHFSYTMWIGLARTVCMQRIRPYFRWFPCQKYRKYTVFMWFWPTLDMKEKEPLESWDVL